MADLTCPKCNSQMQSGVIRQSSWTSSPLFPMVWSNHEAGPLKIFGLKIGGGLFSITKPDNLPILTYRCINCGFLESYAVRGKSYSYAVSSQPVHPQNIRAD